MTTTSAPRNILPSCPSYCRGRYSGGIADWDELTLDTLRGADLSPALARQLARHLLEAADIAAAASRAADA